MYRQDHHAKPPPLETEIFEWKRVMPKPLSLKPPVAVLPKHGASAPREGVRAARPGAGHARAASVLDLPDLSSARGILANIAEAHRGTRSVP